MNLLALWIIPTLIFGLLITGCGSSTAPEIPPPPSEELFIRGADLSMLPVIEREGVSFYGQDSMVEPMLTTLKKAGVNTVRLRIWKDPSEADHGYAAVKEFASRLKSLRFKVMLTVHYSDTWADPGHQEMPKAWKGITLPALLDSVYRYTGMVAGGIKPDFIQIGNEINNGFMFEPGRITTSSSGFKALLDTASKAVRKFSPASKIIIHYAGVDHASNFFRSIRGSDFDLIGLSYYPMWHGKNVDSLDGRITALNNEFGKRVVIVETSYPFTLGWNDWTHNVVGLEEQLVPGYPATPAGQLSFLKKIFSETQAGKGGAGVCYWGGELVAFRGTTSTNGSSYENQAFYDFNFHLLPVVAAFGL